jgi:cobalt/nickel transport system permease protein
LRILFLIIFLSLLYLKNIELILLSIFTIFLIDFKNIFKRSKKVFISIFLFNLGVSLGYILMAYIKGISPWHYIIYINLKVFMLTYFVFMFFEKVNIVKFFSFSKDLSYLLTMTLSQIFSYKKTFEDFKMAFKSRVVSVKNKEKKFITNTLKFFFKKAFKDSKEKSLALKARGFFNDNGDNK